MDPLIPAQNMGTNAKKSRRKNPGLLPIVGGQVTECDVVEAIRYRGNTGLKCGDDRLFWLPATTTMSVDDLLVWKWSPGEDTRANLPPSTSRPNPVICGSMILASLFRPGQIVALNRKTGELIWRCALGKYAYESVLVAGNIALCGDEHSLSAVDIQRGALLWRFVPTYEGENSHYYSRPVVLGDRVYLGDADGFLNCLDIATGVPIWKTELTTVGRVNTTPITLDGILVTATCAESRPAIFGIDVLTDSVVWRTGVSGPIHHGVLRSGDRVLAASAQTTYEVITETGQIVKKRIWPRREISWIEKCGDLLAVILNPEFYDRRHREWASTGMRPKEELMLDDDKVLYRLPVGRYVSTLRWSEHTGILYGPNHGGLGILEPTTGERQIQITLDSWNDFPDHVPFRFGLPDTDGKFIYAITNIGEICCMRHP